MERTSSIHRICLGLLAGTVALSAHAKRYYPEPDDATVQLYFCPHVPAAPKLDGVLDDPCWRDAPVITDFGCIHIGEGIAREQTWARMVYDETALYIAFRAYEPDIEKIVVKKGRDGKIFKGDCVEIYIRPDLDEVTRYQLVTNVAGARFDSWVTGKARHDKADLIWGGKTTWRAAGKTEEQAWTLEVCLPFADFGIALREGTAIGINLVRLTVAGGTEFSAWACATYEQKDFRYWATLVLGKAPSEPASTLARLVPDWKNRTVAWPTANGVKKLVRTKSSKVRYRKAKPGELQKLDTLIEQIDKSIAQINTEHPPKDLQSGLKQLRTQRRLLAQRIETEIFSPDGLRLFRADVAKALEVARSLEWERLCYALLAGAE